MKQPDFENPCVFVRPCNDFVLFTTFRLHQDWSCGFFLTGYYTDEDKAIVHRTYEFKRDGWKEAFKWLEEHGYISLGDAKARALLTKDWLPPATFEGCGRVSL